MEPILIPIMALMIPIIVVPTSLVLRHRLKIREMEHAERIRALELGLVPRADSISWPGASLCIALGAGVPIGTLLVTWLSTLTNDLPHEVWGAPVVLSFFAIWAAQSLAERMLGSKKDVQTADGNSSRSPADRTDRKPVLDPDAFDVVGSRG